MDRSTEASNETGIMPVFLYCMVEDAMGVSLTKTVNILRRLQDEGKIVRLGKGKACRYGVSVSTANGMQLLTNKPQYRIIRGGGIFA